MSVTTLHWKKKKKHHTFTPHDSPARQKKKGCMVLPSLEKREKKKKKEHTPNNETSFLITVTTGNMKLELSHKWITYFPEIDKKNKFRQPAAFPTEIDSICGM